MITYSDTKQFKKEDVYLLFDSVGWQSARNATALVQAFAHSSIVISAWHKGELIALIRAMSDGVWQATIDCLLVHKQYQHQGIGTQLVQRMKQSCSGVLYLNVIPDDLNNVAYYEKHNFVVNKEGTLLQITNKNW